jgi:hypothetical protein
MLKATVDFYDPSTPPLVVSIGTGEDVRAPRELAALERGGWVVDPNVTLAMKAFLAAKRQGDVDPATGFDAWVETVAGIDVELTDKQLDQAVIAGQLTAEQVGQIKSMREVDSGVGEAHASPPA